MKTNGRPQSNNIQDQRAYFGTDSVGIGNVDQDQSNIDFLQQSFGSSATWKGTSDWNTFSNGVANPYPSTFKSNAPTPKVKKGTKY